FLKDPEQLVPFDLDRLRLELMTKRPVQKDFQVHLLDTLLSKEEDISRLLQSNYEKEVEIGNQLAPLVVRRKKELERLRNKLENESSGSDKDWGDLRRLTPFCPEWGTDRGRCIDRYYIENFLESNRVCIRGSVLEVHDADYTVQFGGEDVEVSDVIDIDPGNPRATIIADLRDAQAIATHSYDCFIMTQTLHVIYDMRSVLAECIRILKPGGVLLATIPCAGKIAPEQGLDGDFWRMTKDGVYNLFSEFFDPDQLEVQSYGNVQTNIAYFYGLACHELTEQEFKEYDPETSLLVSVCGRTTGEPLKRL
ncbi:MAG: methyltransferase domain-containing protein, partial [Candidatus Electrothrix sp. MAN1_4]|nr:methyltransferase domain-containing protein [Candidatus Electrothrix sp. MAN1_4]